MVEYEIGRNGDELTGPSKPLVSVVIPVYNTRPDDLRTCFDSLSQAKDARLEIVAVDDGSHVKTANLLDEIAAGCPNAVRVIHKTNGGQSSARNRGIAEARGEYIEFVDSDDYVDWDAQQRVLEVLGEHKPDILQINVVGMTEAGVYFWPPKHGTGEYREIDKREIMTECAAMWAQLVKRELFETSGIDLCEGIHIGEDFASILSLTVAAENAAALDVDLYYFIDHDSSITHVPHPEMLLDITEAMDFVLLHAGDSISQYHDEIEYQAIKQVRYAGIVRALDWEGLHSPAIPKLIEYMKEKFPSWEDNPYYQRVAASQLKYRLIIDGHYILYSILHRGLHMVTRVRSIIRSIVR